MSVVAAVDRELERLPADLQESALAATALAMAERIDNPNVSATAASMCAAKLMDAMQALRTLAPPKSTNDAIDDLTKRRAKRRSASAASARS